MGYPAKIVYGMVIPGAAVSVLFGNLYYAHMAKKLAIKENRTDVTALAYGISTPPMFIFLFGVLKPALDITGDPYIAIQIGMAACFLGGLIEVMGAAIGMLVMVIVFVGLLAQKRMPFRIPASLFAIIIGTVFAYVLKVADISQITDGLSHVGFYLPLPTLGFIAGFKLLFGPFIGLLAALIPISVYNFIETMNNVEAMAAAGDDYDVAETQLIDGLGTMVGTFFGGVFPTTVYLASVSSKWLGGGRGYSIVNGIVFFIASSFGIIAAMAAIIPLQVVAPILVFVGITMVAQTFSSIPQKHFPAAILAMFPYLANYMSTKFGKAAPEALAAVSSSVVPLGQGAMFSAIILGSMLVFIIDDEYKKASIISFIGAGMAAAGFIHSPELSIMQNPEFVLAYVIAGIALFGFSFIEHTDENKIKITAD